MASTKKTSRLGLNLWQETDKPERADFVSDNEIIEENLAAHLRDSAKHLTTTEKNRATQPFQLFDFTGNGTAQRTYTLNFSPRAVFVFSVDRLLTEDGETEDGTPIRNIFHAVQLGGYHTPGISFSGKYLQLTQQTEADAAEENPGYRLRLNDYNKRYVGIAFQ